MSYVKTGLNLTESQKESIKKAYVNKQPVSIKLTASQLSGNDHLGLTKAQYKKVTLARNKKTGVSLKLSKTQVAKQGGFLAGLANLVKFIAPTLLKKVLPALGIAAASGAISGATNKAVQGKGVRRKRGRPKKAKRQGSGLILGPNSPFKNIPLLNILL